MFLQLSYSRVSCNSSNAHGETWNFRIEARFRGWSRGSRGSLDQVGLGRKNSSGQEFAWICTRMRDRKVKRDIAGRKKGHRRENCRRNAQWGCLRVLHVLPLCIRTSRGLVWIRNFSLRGAMTVRKPPAEKTDLRAAYWFSASSESEVDGKPRGVRFLSCLCVVSVWKFLTNLQSEEIPTSGDK